MDHRRATSVMSPRIEHAALTQALAVQPDLHAAQAVEHAGRAGLTPCDRLVLTPAFSRLAHDAHSVATLAQDLIGELQTHDRAQAQ